MVKIKHSDFFGSSEIELPDEPVWRMGDPRAAILEKYIHTNECSDEGGWFAFFSLPDGTDEGYYAGWDERVNGCASEEEAVRQLVAHAVKALQGEASWQAIETAPKNGTPVLLYLPDEREWKRYTVGVWDIDRWCGLSPSATGTIWHKQPTHWMELPAPPSPSE